MNCSCSQKTRDGRIVQGNGSQATANRFNSGPHVLDLRKDFKIRFPYPLAQTDLEIIISHAPNSIIRLLDPPVKVLFFAIES